MQQKIVILGAGESGTGAALLAKDRGYDTFVSDNSKIAEQYKVMLLKYNIAFEEEGHTTERLLDADEVIKSPGIPATNKFIQLLKEHNIPVISEIEFTTRFTQAKKICITGSNGKTTTTHLVCHILKQAGWNAGMVGNVGTSFARQVWEDPKDIYVIELSSFQLEDMYMFKAEIAILLNITPDHLDRYEYDIDQYAKAKMRIVRNQTKNDFFIYCQDDPWAKKYAEKINTEVQKIPFGLENKSGNKAYIEDNKMIVNYSNQKFIMMKEDLTLQGQHNTYNSMAAAITARVLHIRDEHIRASLSSYKGVEHRLEQYLSIRGIMFVNDSKATNINSTWYALDSMQNPTVWIVGGIDKGNDYSVLDELVKNKVKGIICLGKDNQPIIEHFRLFGIPMEEMQSMEDAVKKSYEMADKGDTVLLSPACASFDLFKNFEDRGNQFKQHVRNL